MKKGKKYTLKISSSEISGGSEINKKTEKKGIFSVNIVFQSYFFKTVPKRTDALYQRLPTFLPPQPCQMISSTSSPTSLVMSQMSFRTVGIQRVAPEHQLEN